MALHHWGSGVVLVLLGLPAFIARPAEAADSLYAKKGSWAETVAATRAGLAGAGLEGAAVRAAGATLWDQLSADFPVACDWVRQDFGPGFRECVTPAGAAAVAAALDRVLGELGPGAGALAVERDRMQEDRMAVDDARWLDLYVRACEQRRTSRLATLRVGAPRVVFTRHHTIRPSFFAYTEGQSDAQAERHFLPGAALCLLELDGPYATVRTLLDDPTGAIRDPAVSWDGRRVLFAWKKALNEDDYHLYELDVPSGWVRQITFGLGFADYEPAYLPNGDIVFASTRCVQTVDCWWTEVSNLFTCDPDGRYLRRLGFDQVHTVYPQVLGDGRVVYTRWDYNDRGQVFPQALFQMNPDGTGQTEFYGNNSWFPTTIAHARGIPGTQNVLAILCGHHSSQAGKLAVIDPARGRHENQGVQLVAPIRETRADRIDAYGQEGELWQYPYPLNEREFLVTYAPDGWNAAGRRNRRQGDADFAIYWMDLDGRRELLAADPHWPCQQPVPLTARIPPPVRPSTVDYRAATGTFYLQDIHAGPGLAGVPRGSIKKLRIVALEFSPAGVGDNRSGGPGGGALISTPIAIGNGSWDVKRVLGETRVHPDGSALFEVPARTPLYFQAIDTNGFAVQTMRSWSTLQPGETQSCVGCHEHKNSAPPAQGYRGTLAMKAGLQPLVPFHGPPRGFSFPKDIQPILDRHCVRCHHDRSLTPSLAVLDRAPHRERDPDWRVGGLPMLLPEPAPRAGAPSAEDQPAFSLLPDEVVDAAAKRRWSDAYLNLTLARSAARDDRGGFLGLYDGRMVNWIGSQSIPAPLPPYTAGAFRSELFTLLDHGHYGVALSRAERDKLACWIDLLVPYCGDYREANAWTDADAAKFERYAEKRARMEQVERRNIEALLEPTN